jgi:anti-sigma factor RsiW
MSATGCARFAPLLSARPGELPPAEEQALLAHLAGCDACQALLADGKALEGLVAEGLLAEAARVDFAPFVDQVMARIERPRGLRGILRLAARHKVATAAAALAPALAALAVILYVSGGAPEVPEAGDVEVIWEGRAPVVLTTESGPVVLLGDAAEPEGF